MHLNLQKAELFLDKFQDLHLRDNHIEVSKKISLQILQNPDVEHYNFNFWNIFYMWWWCKSTEFICFSIYEELLTLTSFITHYSSETSSFIFIILKEKHMPSSVMIGWNTSLNFMFFLFMNFTEKFLPVNGEHWNNKQCPFAPLVNH